MKKILSVILTTVLILTLVPCFTSAAPAVPSLYMRPQFNEAKNHLTVEVYTYGLNWTSLDLGIQFDTTALTLISVTDGGKIGAARRKNVDIMTGSRDVASANALGYVNFIASVATPNYKVTTTDGAIVVFAFTVKDLAKAKMGYHLCVSHLTDSKGKKLQDYTAFSPESTPVVHLSNANNPFRYGDLTGDGVDIYDAMLVLQYIVGTESFDEYHINSAKVSGESEISIYDAMLILQRVVGLNSIFPVEG